MVVTPPGVVAPACPPAVTLPGRASSLSGDSTTFRGPACGSPTGMRRQPVALPAVVPADRQQHRLFDRYPPRHLHGHRPGRPRESRRRPDRPREFHRRSAAASSASSLATSRRAPLTASNRAAYSSSISSRATSTRPTRLPTALTPGGCAIRLAASSAAGLTAVAELRLATGSCCATLLSSHGCSASLTARSTTSLATFLAGHGSSRRRPGWQWRHRPLDHCLLRCWLGRRLRCSLHHYPLRGRTRHWIRPRHPPVRQWEFPPAR